MALCTRQQTLNEAYRKWLDAFEPEEKRVLKYRCPACGADPGKPCRSPRRMNNGRPTRNKTTKFAHPARHAKRILAEGS